MKRYEVVFSDRALADLESSFQWGCEKWGISEAAEWYFSLQDRVSDTLTRLPLGYPLAPDQDRYMAETRVLSIGRYNVLFNVSGNTVTIVHIRGPFIW